MKKRNFKLKLRLPEAHLPRRRVEHCDGCKEPIEVGRGYGYCTNCMLTTPIPIARVLSRGSHRGKYVYLKSAILRQIREDYDSEDVKDVFESELRSKDYLIVEEYD